ncbi:MAG: D-beta-D-heptose 7-phosphate kinase / D-beta-D-heptose 1-phosphate adenosyltransferase [Solirubrobacteraceae bacterium]|nr:D-beta-D-heptose 7-phosphate kinase / D-beta-D-heptose 1-phosphate adenosyltransferase [Solirubrobacteraceae bacterium]
MTRLVVVGDALLDCDVEGAVERLSPDAPVPVVEHAETRTRPGGAALAAVLAARDGHDVILVTALADDAAGAELRAALERWGIELVDVGLDGETPQKLRVRVDGRSLLRIDTGGREGRVRPASAAARAAIAWAPAVLVADYGRGLTADPAIRSALVEARGHGGPLVWDPHPHGASPVEGATLCTPNESEARRLTAPGPAGEPGPAGAEAYARALAAGEPGLAGAEACARALARVWRADHVCVTRGAAGAVMVRRDGGHALAVPAAPVTAGDPCGAGDRFAATAAGALTRGASVAEAVRHAVSAATAFVRAGGAAALRLDAPPRAAAPTVEDVAAIERVRAEGGVVVATGGCFDLLHAGHVQTLQAARGLGDCLVVCLNGDASVRRLKGPDRPLVPQQDRAALLAALSCVDAVTIFEDDTPERVLEELRPDIWAKGGDYSDSELPEAAVLERWGGRAVILPFLDGRSTTKLIEQVAVRAGA